MSPAELRDFTSYDLARLHEALLAERARRREGYGIPMLWAAAQALLPWDQRYRKCWDDPTFTARYRFLRARLVPADAPYEYPISSIVHALGELLAERQAQEAEEPF